MCALKTGKSKILKVFWNSKTKDLNRITNIDQGYLWLIRFLTNDHGYVPLVVSTFQSFPPHSLLFTGVVTRLTRRVSLAEHELLTLPEHMSSDLLVGFVLLDL